MAPRSRRGSSAEKQAAHPDVSVSMRVPRMTLPQFVAQQGWAFQRRSCT